jgi:hypothetical protein
MFVSHGALIVAQIVRRIGIKFLFRDVLLRIGKRLKQLLNIAPVEGSVHGDHSKPWSLACQVRAPFAFADSKL